MADGRTSVDSRRAFVDIAGQTGGKLVSLALSVVATLALVRELGGRLFGQWATLLAVVQILGAWGDVVVDLTVVREAARAPHREPVLIGTLVWLRTVLSSGSAVVAVAALLIIGNDSGARWA